MAFTGVNLGSFFEEGEGFAFERSGRLVEFFSDVSGDGFSFEVGLGGFEDRLDPGVDGFGGDGFQDGEAFFGIEPRGNDGGLEADAGRFVGGCFLKEFSSVGDLVAGVTEDFQGGGADTGVFCTEKIFEKGLADLVESPRDPERFEEGMLVVLRAGTQGGDPLFERGKDFAGITAAELTTRAVAGAVFRESEVFEEGGKGCIVNLSRLYEGTIGVGDAINAAVLVITERIAGAVLHVADENVVPVDDEEGAIRGELEVDGAVVAVLGDDEIVAVF